MIAAVLDERLTLPETFWAKVDITLTCWLWIACQSSRGYGCFAINGRSQLVHRLSYRALVGPIPEGFTIDHVAELCTSKLCVNPDHLEPVTREENYRRWIRLVTTCSAGHPLTRRPGDRQRRCQPCETARQRARRSDLRPRPPGECAGVGRATRSAAGEGAPGFTPVSGRTASPP